MAHKRIEVTLHGGPSDGKTVIVNTDTDEYHDRAGGDDPDASGGVYVKDGKGVFRWETS